MDTGNSHSGIVSALRTCIHFSRLYYRTRCAAEILAALSRGSKHWPFDKTERLWAWAAPLIRNALDKVSVETIGDWGTCFATASESRDPNRMHWMLEVLMEEPLQSRGAFMDSSRLYVLQGAVAQQEWRAGRMLHRLLEFLRPYCSHPYQQVRDRMGSVITNIFLNDLDFPGRGEASNKRSPRIADFLAEVAPQLEILTEEPDPALLVPRIPEVAASTATTVASGAAPTPRPPTDMNGGAGGGVVVRPPPPRLGPGGAVPPRMPFSPEVMARMRMPPPPEILARLRGPPPPEVLARLPRVPPPEVLARLSWPPPPELLARLPGPPPSPEVLAQMLGGPPPPPELLAQLAAAAMGGAPPPSQDGMVSPLSSSADAQEPQPQPPPPSSDPEYEKRQMAIRLAQTVCKFLSGSLMRAFNGVKRESYGLLPVLCMNESNEFEPHLAKDCTYALACLSQTLLPMDVVGDCLDAVEQVATKSTSWKAKCAVLEVLGVSTDMALKLHELQ